MKKQFELNGKTYEIDTKINFQSICEMEEYGVDLMSLGKSKQTFSQIRNMVAYFTKLDPEEAGEEISAHIDNGGKLADVFVLFNVIAESDFFQKAVAQAKK